ncbi:dienelactone hydrolase family protein [Flavobacteriaceae bacterium TP-CH-4]|uniref:Dienelactone hydrolase family protein n=1 Tax=Pelagihabitans pacificus TaxID=2696054 RepID=A0A967EA77_9FLAO|nr:dienelactone hydrolase family protein [Pelagihabitans pacificus]NHF59161.1 dienelactone hydrolase family protein [Pelagihabitans pacificus]
MGKLKVVCSIFLVAFLACKQNTQEKKAAEETISREPLLEGKEITYSTDSTEMKGYVVYDKNVDGKRPGILVVHEWWGHNEYVRERADMLAELGYTAIAVDMYGNGKQAAHPEDAGKFSGMVMSNIEAAQARFDAAMEVLKNNPTVAMDQIAAIGYCFGGSVVLTMANAGKDLDAVAAFHSGVQLPIMPNEKLKAKVLVANGAADPFVSPESVANFTRAMDSIQADYKYIAYENAKHAYTSKEATALGEKFNLPLEYNAEADEKSWEALKRLLNDTFGENASE